jgi:hypothetical protein
VVDQSFANEKFRFASLLFNVVNRISLQMLYPLAYVLKTFKFDSNCLIRVVGIELVPLVP